MSPGVVNVPMLSKVHSAAPSSTLIITLPFAVGMLTSVNPFVILVPALSTGPNEPLPRNAFAALPSKLITAIFPIPETFATATRFAIFATLAFVAFVALVANVALATD